MDCRVAPGNTHDGLGRQMKDGVDLVLPQHSFHQTLILDLAMSDFDPVNEALRDQFTLGHPMPHQADHVGARVQEPGYQPAP